MARVRRGLAYQVPARRGKRSQVSRTARARVSANSAGLCGETAVGKVYASGFGMRAQTPGPRPFLSLLDATFRLGDRLIFQNTNWIFHRDEHWAVVGQNGSGKSLFADALRGRLPLIHGELCYHFRPPPGFSAEDAIGHVSFEERKSELHEM